MTHKLEFCSVELRGVFNYKTKSLWRRYITCIDMQEFSIIKHPNVSIFSIIKHLNALKNRAIGVFYNWKTTYQVSKRNLMFYNWKFLHINARDIPLSKAICFIIEYTPYIAGNQLQENCLEKITADTSLQETWYQLTRYHLTRQFYQLLGFSRQFTCNKSNLQVYAECKLFIPS